MLSMLGGGLAVVRRRRSNGQMNIAHADHHPVRGDDELQRERSYLDAAYERVMAMRRSAEGMAGNARRTEVTNVQALFERDSAIVHAGRRLAALDIAKDRLVVGRLDFVRWQSFVRRSPGRRRRGR